MALCEQCGSINIVRAQSDPSDRVVAFFTSKRPFVCRRCGWRGRRDWKDRDLRELMNYGAGGAEPDPSLAVLDREPHARPDAFDMAALDAAAGPPTQRRRRKFRNRPKRSRRREVIATIAVTALVMFFVVLLGLTGSCSGGTAVL